MTLFQRLANKEFSQEETKVIERLFELAKTTVDGAIAEAFMYLRIYFAARPEEFHAAFIEIYHRAQRDAYREGRLHDDYLWPTSFPHCTPALQEFVNQWIHKEFSNKLQTKCLILIGPTNTGKTTFAQSLPGLYNYYDNEWDPDVFNPYADYTIYDNIHWDQFETMNYPDKKLLPLQGSRIHTMNNHDHATTVDVNQPAIVLFDPDHQSSLAANMELSVNQTDENFANIYSNHFL